MPTIDRTIEVLNYFYFVFGFIAIWAAIVQTYNSLFYQMHYLAMIIYWITLFMIFFNFFVGRSALDRNDPDKLRKFAILVFVCVLIQLFAMAYQLGSKSQIYWMVPKKNLFSRFDRLPREEKEDIQRMQQLFSCCAYNGWQDYEKPPSEIPG